MEPVKCVCLNVVDGKDKKDVYVAVAFITKVCVFKNKEVVFQDAVLLNTNIVMFEDAYVAVKRTKNGFIFLNRKGNVTVYDIETQKKSTYKYPNPDPEPFTTLTQNLPNIYMCS